MLSLRLAADILIAGLFALFAARAPCSPAVSSSTAATARAVGRAGAALCLLWTLSLEVWLAGGTLAARHVALSLVWTFYALAAMGLGLRYAHAGLRVGALALLGLTVVKVFVFDLGRVDSVYRILSFLILGGVLLLASFLYTHHRVQA